MLLPRFLTALIGVPLLLLSIWWGQIPFLILTFGVSMLALYEYYTLMEEARWPVSKWQGLLSGFILFLTLTFFGTSMGWNANADLENFPVPFVIAVLLIGLAILSLFNKKKETAFLDFILTWFGLFYVIWTLSHIFLIRDIRHEGREYTFFLFIVIWALDIGAYLGGKQFGKNKCAEFISPKKTWEGVLTGSLSALMAALICRFTFFKSLPMQNVFILSAVIITLAQFSDLSESLFKRNVNVKDSGNLLPGHGGILDRFDSFLLTAPAYYYMLLVTSDK